MRKRYVFAPVRALSVEIRGQDGGYEGEISGRYLSYAPESFWIDDCALLSGQEDGLLLLRAFVTLLQEVRGENILWLYDREGSGELPTEEDARLSLAWGAARLLGGYEVRRFFHGRINRVELSRDLAGKSCLRCFDAESLAREGFAVRSFADCGSLAAELPQICAGEQEAARFFPEAVGRFDPHLAFFALQEGQPAGWVYLSEEGEDLSLSHFFVREKFRGLASSGAKLLTFLAKEVMLPRYRTLEFQVRDNAPSIDRMCHRIFGEPKPVRLIYRIEISRKEQNHEIQGT